MSPLLCVKYIINSHFELQPKGYSHLKLQNTKSSLVWRYRCYSTKLNSGLEYGVFMLSEVRGDEH